MFTNFLIIETGDYNLFLYIYRNVGLCFYEKFVVLEVLFSARFVCKRPNYLVYYSKILKTYCKEY